MNLYLDTSALVKRYLVEWGSNLVRAWTDGAALLGTSNLAHAEAAAAFRRAERERVLRQDEARRVYDRFRRDWPDLLRIPAWDTVVDAGAALAWEHGLRGYDAVHLASALFWQEVLGDPVTVATFDGRLHAAAAACGLPVLPEDTGALRPPGR